MSKTRLEKIADYDEQIAHIKNLQKMERQKHSKEERAARTRRLCSRHGLLEKMLPEIVTISDEQYQTFLERAVMTETARKLLSDMSKQTTATAPPQASGSAAQTSKPTTPKPAETKQDEDTDEGKDGGNGARVTG